MAEKLYLVTESTKKDIQRLIRKVDNAKGFAVNSPDALVAHPQQPGGDAAPRGLRFYLAKLTSAISGQVGRFNARSVAPAFNVSATGNIAAANVGTEATADDVVVWEVDAIKDYRIGFVVGHTSAGKPILVAIPRGVFPVKLTQTGGSAGNQSTAVSFTYTVKTLNDETIATAHAPTWPSRSENGLKTAATEGMAWYDGATLKVQAFERAGTGGC